MIFASALFFLTAGLSDTQMREIGLRVWQNECAATIDGLTSWNERESFASLGIGHFIWYPKGRGPYVETFPALIAFLKKNGVDLPRWLDESKRCPWKTREEFLRAKGSKKMLDLKKILKDTIPLQAQFLVFRLEDALPNLQRSANELQREKILCNYRRLKEAPSGLYALIDYVNFKGYGTSEQERYADSGWGLLQVLERMSEEKDAIDEFIRCAKEVLSERVKNAPAERGEQLYLQGWHNRLDTYRPMKPPK